MKIYYHPYSLKAKNALNAKSSSYEYHGVLLKIGEGHACLHPWQQLGDPPLNILFKQLQQGQKNPLITQAFNCAAADAAGRKQGKSLFQDLLIPESHATITGGMAEIESALANGFSTVKLKTGKNPAREITLLTEINRHFPNLPLRLDFNNALTSSELLHFLDSLNSSTRQQIEFLEDPYKNKVEEKNAAQPQPHDFYQIPLAIDQEVETYTSSFAYAVAKPAKNNTSRILKNCQIHHRKCVITSYMDHPIGQAYAAYNAGLAWRKSPEILSLCGLMTHDLFLQTPFSECLGNGRSKWSYNCGTGLGFNDLLETIPWKSLN